MRQLLWALPAEQRVMVAWFVFGAGHESLALFDQWCHACHTVRDYPNGYP